MVVLFYKNQKAIITVDDCIKERCNRNKNQYKKGLIDKKLADEAVAFGE